MINTKDVIDLSDIFVPFSELPIKSTFGDENFVTLYNRKKEQIKNNFRIKKRFFDVIFGKKVRVAN